MLQKQRRSFLWCWRCGALGVWHLTWTVLTERSHTQRPSPPLPTIQPPTTPYNPHNPPTTTQHYATPILPTLPTVQYNPAPSSERPLSWKMSPFYPTLCLLRIFTEVSAPSFFLFFRCPGNMPPLVLFLFFQRTMIIFIDITCEDSLHLIWRAARPWSPEMSTPGQHSCPSPF